MGILDEALLKVMKENKEEIEKMDDEKFTNFLSEITIKQTDKLAKKILKDLKKTAPDMLEEHRYEREEFEARLKMRWRKPLNDLETLIHMSLESGEMFCEDFEKRAEEENNITFYAIKRIHARAVQISNEILTLLKAGYCEGALGRWRTLHELSVICILLSNNLNNELSKRYIDYSLVEIYNEEKSFFDTANKKTKKQEKNLQELKKQYDSLINIYGKEFSKSNGWAYCVIKKEKITFRDIEELVDMSHLRPYYKKACTTTHASPKGDLYKLGIIEEFIDEVIPCGPSNYGLSIPGQNTAISLNIITGHFLNLYISMDSLTNSKIINLFTNEILIKFDKTQCQIELEELEEK